MSLLPSKHLKDLDHRYFNKHGLHLEEVDELGAICNYRDTGGIRNIPSMTRARSLAMTEAVRWGEASVFFQAPGVISWIVPVIGNNGKICGGILGGEVIPDGIALDRAAIVYHLLQTGQELSSINMYIDQLSIYPQNKIQEAGEYIRESLRHIDEGLIKGLDKNRDDALQQREIAQFIQEKKTARSSSYSLDQERILLSLIRIGDKNAARGVLNDMLASSFLYAPKLTVMKARLIETMGHLVRSAIEDSPVLDRLLTRQQQWSNAIIEADDFNMLCTVIRGALDDFIEQIFLQGFNRTNTQAGKALEYIHMHYMKNFSLQDIANHMNISKYRIAHLIKDVTGQSIFQHVKKMRIKKAQELLINTNESYADITYALSFTDQSAFIKQFREATGTTPAKYRRNNRN